MTRDELIEFYAIALATARFGPDGQVQPLPSDIRKAKLMVEEAEKYFNDC